MSKMQIGEKRYNCNRKLMMIVDIEDRRRKIISVKFLDDNSIKENVSYNSFIRGNVNSPYEKIYCNRRGFEGEGNYDIEEDVKLYNKWEQLLLNENIELSENICNFNMFCKWYENNEYICKNDKGQKVYMTIHSFEKVWDIDNIFLVPKTMINMLRYEENINELMKYRAYTKCNEADIQTYIYTDNITNNKKPLEGLCYKEEAENKIKVAQIKYLHELLLNDKYTFNDRTYNMLLSYVNMNMIEEEEKEM